MKNYQPVLLLLFCGKYAENLMFNLVFNFIDTTILAKIYETNFSVIAHYGKSSISIFKQFFACIDKILISGGRLGTRLYLGSAQYFLIS